MRSSLLVGLIVAACRGAPSSGTTSDAAPPGLAARTGLGIDAATAGVVYDLRDAAIDASAILPRLTKPPWIKLQAINAAPEISFHVEDDDTAVFHDGPRVWRGRVEHAAVVDVERVMQSNQFCAMANGDKDHHLLSFMVISRRGFDCYVQLSYEDWKKNPRARAVYQAVHRLLQTSCGAPCRSPDFPDD